MRGCPVWRRSLLREVRSRAGRRRRLRHRSAAGEHREKNDHHDNRRHTALSLHDTLDRREESRTHQRTSLRQGKQRFGSWLVGGEQGVERPPQHGQGHVGRAPGYELVRGSARQCPRQREHLGTETIAVKWRRLGRLGRGRQGLRRSSLAGGGGFDRREQPRRLRERVAFVSARPAARRGGRR